MNRGNQMVNAERRPGSGWRCIEILMIFLLLLVFCGEKAPDINESHYLTKARHFWEPDWCDQDLFVSSPDAHWFFVFSLGWLTKLFSLSTSAWIIRILCWGLFAIAWQRLSFSLVGRRLFSLFTAVGMIVLIRYCHLAGEWIVGGAEAKGFAYVGVVFGLGWMVEKKWGPMWLALGAASMFHVLVGGWSVIGALVVVLISRPNRMEIVAQLKWLAAGGFLSLFGIVPGLILMFGQNPDDVMAANQIYVRVRLPHHLYFWDFEKTRLTLFLFVLIPWIAMAARDRMGPEIRRLNQFCLVMFSIALAGVLVCNASDAESAILQRTANSLLKFYWFRMADAALAIGLPLLLAKSISKWRPGRVTPVLLMIGSSCAVMLVGDLAVRSSDRRPPADASTLPLADRGRDDPRKWEYEHFRNWKKMCLWVRENTPSDSLFLTPREQQTFVWYSHRAQVFCYKDIPQSPAEMVEWNERLEEIYRGPIRYGLFSNQRLSELSGRYGFQYVIVKQESVPDDYRDDDFLEMVYPERRGSQVSYAVFRLKRAEE